MKNLLKRIALGIALFPALAMAAVELTDSAQQPGALKLGIEGGANFSDATSTSDIASSMRAGFVLGVNMDYRLSSIFSVQPEIMYVQRATNIVDNAGIKLTANYDSIQVPFLIKASFGQRVRPYVFAGPVAIVNISRSLTGEVAGKASSLAFNPRTIDFAGTIGAGVEVGSFFANLRYSLDLLDIDPNHVNWRSRGLTLLVGVNLGT